MWTYNGTLYVGISYSFNVTFNTTKTGNFTNFVVVTSNETDNKTTNNTTKVYKPDMTVEKLSLNRTVYVGNQTVFTIVVRNTGDCDLGDVFVVEKAPMGLVYNSFKGTDWSYNNGKFTYGKVLKVNESASFDIVFDTISPGNWTNVVVAGSNETDNKTGNNTTKVYKPDMTVEKLSLNRTVYVGNQTVFTIVVRNTGDCDLGEVFVVEKAPEGLVYNSFKGTDWSYDGSKFTYAKVLKVNESVSFEIVFDAVSSGNWTNVVVAGSNLTGNKTGNNTTKVYNPGLKVEKITLDPVVSVGEITSFEIIVTNTGDCKLGDVFVHEDSYEGLRFHSFRGDMWKQKGDTFYYQGVLNPGESASFVILFTTLKPGNFTNIVTAGSNVTNNTTTENKTKAIENHTNNNTNGTNKTVNNETKEVNVHKVDTSRATGNPLLALLMVLLMISVTTIRKFKK